MSNRKIDVDIWKDKKIKKDITSFRVRYLWFFLLTCPLSTTCGIFKLTFEEMAFYTDLDIDECKQYLMSLHDLNLLEYNPATEEIAIFNYPKYNIYGWTTQVENLLNKELSNVKDINLIKLMCDSLTNFIENHQSEYMKCKLMKKVLEVYESYIKKDEVEEEKPKEEEIPSWEDMLEKLDNKGEKL